MSWNGTIIGTIIGARLGSFVGPWGAVAGAVIGGILGGMNDRESSGTDDVFGRTARGEPLHEGPVIEPWEALFRSYGRLAKSDGLVSREEADLVGAFLRQTGFDTTCKKVLRSAFNEGKENRQSFGRLVTAVKNSFQAGAYADIMSSYCDLALADGRLDDAELAMLREAEAALGLDGFVDRWLREVRGEQRNRREDPPPPPRESAGSTDWAYRLLGISAQCTDDEVKKAWRAKAKEYHPDVLRGKGVEESVIKLAEVQMRRINDAYEAIKRARHI